MRVLGACVLAVTLLACGAAGPRATPTLSADDARAAARADVEAGRLLGNDARLVYRATATTLRASYGTAPAGAAADEQGLFAVYASPGMGLFAEIFVRYADVAVTYARTTNDPVRR